MIMTNDAGAYIEVSEPNCDCFEVSVAGGDGEESRFKDVAND
jgi:hypothetical protein